MDQGKGGEGNKGEYSEIEADVQLEHGSQLTTAGPEFLPLL